jgi:hypothetical protein
MPSQQSDAVDLATGGEVAVNRGTWYSWDSPVGLGIALISLGFALVSTGAALVLVRRALVGG